MFPSIGLAAARIAAIYFWAVRPAVRVDRVVVLRAVGLAFGDRLVVLAADALVVDRLVVLFVVAMVMAPLKRAPGIAMRLDSPGAPLEGKPREGDGGLITSSNNPRDNILNREPLAVGGTSRPRTMRCCYLSEDVRHPPAGPVCHGHQDCRADGRENTIRTDCAH